ncbi:MULTISPECIES: hypothetical protein [Paenarthrobacter]|uniref:Uncharacterized protein n=1 Tax=Paenarthrobacter ureafaciens TaxID=37931 RepID=A0AAX3EKD3_PAEUR|nr:MULTISPECIES: hypothetical protein [Paenarthrobacter]NKR13604.1 hypothetical protein [Arthrobacter sp. M5]NKR16692.1 hypothetical protein [Arthrobacter sp. M6]OEH61819.1 hypothetical protein A5N13_15685 [Arthrobacter sp. D4]OEH64121.1 hypothetical protein A5N17_06665 [Arthrobacter sp. D2]MDO5863447.1 hypothetical protein [Paenarthrobacter sp. SD-2]
MEINALTVQIQDKYRKELADFRKKVLGPEGQSHAGNQHESRRELPRFGPVRTLTDSKVDLTIVADTSDLDWFAEDPSLVGQRCITISIAGHHRLMGNRTSLPSGECDAWVQAILGLGWTEHVYRAGTVSGVAGRPSTVYYRLFLDAESNPRERPEKFKDKEMRPLREL